MLTHRFSCGDRGVVPRSSLYSSVLSVIESYNGFNNDWSTKRVFSVS
jgi:hypothetical protein